MAAPTLQKRTATPSAVPTVAQILDGQWVIRVAGDGRTPAALGAELAYQALAQGAGDLLA